MTSINRNRVCFCALMAACLPLIGDPHFYSRWLISQCPAPPRVKSWPEKLCLVLLILAAATAGMEALSLPFYHWDALALYGFKAKVLFLEGSLKTSVFLDKRLVHPNMDYPLLIPYFEAAIYNILGGIDERLARMLFFVYWLCFLGLVYDGLLKGTRRNLAAILAASLASAPLFFIDDATQAVSGLVDIPFAFYWTGFVLSIIDCRNIRDTRRMGYGLVFLLGCVMTKPHGLLLVPVGIGAFLWFCPKTRKQIFWGSLIFFAVLAPWLWMREHLPHNADYAPRSFDVRLIQEALRRIPIVALAWLREIVRLDVWGLLWITVGAALGYAACRKRLTPEIRLILVLVAAQALVYSCAYLVISTGIGSSMEVTLSRLAIHFSGLAIIAAGWALEALAKRDQETREAATAK